MSGKYIGLMSGTSLDAIDTVLVEFKKKIPTLLAQHNEPIPQDIKAEILALCQSNSHEIDRLSQLEPKISRLFSSSVLNLLKHAHTTNSEITAIGCHGQTIRHYPEKGYTLQIGDPNLLAELTNITVICDFRRRDIAAGGQGAPLVPAFHKAIFSNSLENRVILNIGGISNITVLPSSDKKPLIGFDTGPGNLLLDYWCQRHQHQPYDINGSWASSANTDTPLLSELLNDSYFRKKPPKSTGREYFTPQWLIRALSQFPELPPAVIQTTLSSLTAITIANAVKTYASSTQSLFVCGGGAKNLHLISQLKLELPNITIHNTKLLGLDSDWVEAIAFAWLAYRTNNHLPGNEPSATGATGTRILGGIYPG